MFPARRVIDGARLRQIREDAGLTLQALADELAAVNGRGKASKGYLSRLENDDPDVIPSGVYIGRIAKVLKVSPDEFSTRVSAEDAA